ncbi:MAG: PspA/IM30 family protein [Pseudomonadota bacterium]
MPLLKRFSRLVGADLHAMLDQIEDPDTMARQGLRDMQAEVDRLDGEIARLVSRRDDLERTASQARADVAAADDRLDLCLHEGREDLARGLVRRKLQAAERAAGAEASIERCDADLGELQALQARRQETLADLRMRLDDLRAAPPPTHSAPAGPSPEEVEVALLAEIAARRPS